MIGKRKRLDPVMTPASFGWADEKIVHLQATLESDRPQFQVDILALRTTFGRQVYEPDNLINENELLGESGFYRARVEGNFSVAPIGTVGGLRFASMTSGGRAYSPLITFHLHLLTGDQEWQLQQILQVAFANGRRVTVGLVLLPVDDPNARIRELREEGDFDSLPLRSFNVWTDVGTAKFDV